MRFYSSLYRENWLFVLLRDISMAQQDQSQNVFVELWVYVNPSAIGDNIE